MKQLEEFKNSVGFSLTFDIWTTHNFETSMLAITYHWLSHNFECHEAVFDVITLDKKHTASYLAICIAKAVDSRTSPNQILFGTCCDNGANICKAAKLLVSQYEEIKQQPLEEIEEDLDLGLFLSFSFFLRLLFQDEKDPEVSRAGKCFAHTLNLVIQHSLEADIHLSRLISKVQSVVKSTRRFYYY